MKKVISALCIMLLTTLGIYYGQKNFNEKQNTRNSGEAIAGSSARRAAPNFDLANSQGKSFQLESLQGQMTLVHFWASWCSPCLAEIPEWIQLGQTLQNDPIHLVAISLDSAWPEAQKVFPTGSETSRMISLLDTSGKVAEAFGSYQYPETYLLDQNLRIVTKWVGPQKWNDEKMQNLIKKFLESTI